MLRLSKKDSRSLVTSRLRLHVPTDLVSLADEASLDAWSDCKRGATRLVS